MSTVYERAGGFAHIHQLVIALFREARKSPQLKSYFAGIKMHRLIEHQTRFLIQIMCGPGTRITNKQLRRAHQRLDINDAGFFAMVEFLKKTMKNYGLDNNDINEVEDQILLHKRYIVSDKREI